MAIPPKITYSYICHSYSNDLSSFCLAGNHKTLNRPSFGILPIHKTKMELADEIFSKLARPLFLLWTQGDGQLYKPRLKVLRKRQKILLGENQDTL